MTYIPTEFIKALEAFFRYSVHLNYISEGRSFMKMKLEPDGSGMVLDMDRGLHFAFNDPTDICIKSHVSLIGSKDPEEGDEPLLLYSNREEAFSCLENATLFIPYTLFREAVETVQRDQNCSMQVAVQTAIKWRYWRNGKPFFSFAGEKGGE